ncbi:acetamidase/formamidase family protein [Pseudogracilibacillus auburnensis]|uniref:acetamidase/formamidase family protein n=1 Tax=Pseudogracilibacillus auburnensis TaxID=1494959 RepID=UPI001A95F016|nr:acetamidase/formamidase family protein [Pseudogracilibacillus auburnensis]MBO1002005.1 acetamidase/formamidase family protein [Pseudogracilibacillus auburnensis]
MNAKQTVFVDQYTDGILDPNKEMEYVVKDGGHIVANTTPGCWGPMITPALKGGHEVTKPVFVEGAEIGDAIMIYIKSIEITSFATASGNDKPVDGRFNGDPFVAAICPVCHTINPETVIKGIGNTAIHCKNCDSDITPFNFTHAYTIAFDDKKSVGLTLNKNAAEQVAGDGRKFMCTPENSIQNPIVTFAPNDMPGTMARIRAFLGQLGTTPARALPDSHNAGDFGQFLIDAPHDYGITEEQLEDRTDGHMDINRVRAGAVLICPVKVKGGGVYLGDMHAMQGDGEIAGHTADVAGIVSLQVRVLKNMQLDGPILLPVEEDLPYLAKPFTEQEKICANQLAKQWKMDEIDDLCPISFIGTGANLNDATTNGMERAANFFDITIPEVMNRSTINGAIEIGRHPGVVTVTFLAPESYLDNKGLLDIVKEHYLL